MQATSELAAPDGTTPAAGIPVPAIAGRRAHDHERRGLTLFDEAGLDLPQVLERIAAHVAEVLGDACGVFLLARGPAGDGDALRAVASSHRDPSLRPLVRGFLGTDIVSARTEAYARALASGRCVRLHAAALS